MVAGHDDDDLVLLSDVSMRDRPLNIIPNNHVNWPYTLSYNYEKTIKLDLVPIWIPLCNFLGAYVYFLSLDRPISLNRRSALIFLQFLVWPHPLRGGKWS